MSRFHAMTLLALALACGLVFLTQGSARAVALAALACAYAVLVFLGVTFASLQMFGHCVTRGPGGEKRVALTFDDGPDPASTPALLDLLREAGVRAAFFCAGRKVEERPDIAARAAKEGHLICNHSFEHSNATNLLGQARLNLDMERAQRAIEAATGLRPALFRPPMGLTNPRVFRAARRLGLTVVGWTARGMEAREPDPDRVAERLARALEPGAILLLHDGGIPAERLVATASKLLDRIRAAGYRVVRLDDLIESPPESPIRGSAPER